MLATSTGFDAYRVYAEAERKTGSTVAAATLASMEGSTLFMVGAASLKLIANILQTPKEKATPPANVLIATLAFTIAAASGYAFTMGTEQWTNTIFTDNYGSAVGYTPEAHAGLMFAGMPHGVANTIIEGYVLTKIGIAGKDMAVLPRRKSPWAKS